MMHRILPFQKPGKPQSLTERYGSWALVAGGSTGLGAAFSEALARRGLNLLLSARRQGPLDRIAERLEHDYQVSVETMPLDLAEPGAAAALADRAVDLGVGLLVANAAFAPVARFLDVSEEDHLKVLRVNCESALILVRRIVPKMVSRGRGAVILVSSMAGFQGTELVAHYAATKAYLRVLAEGLWAELGPHGISVLATCPGPVDTETFRATNPKTGRLSGLKPLPPAQVAEETLAALGKTPLVVPGRTARWTSWTVRRLLPHSLAIRLSSAGTRRLYSDGPGSARDPWRPGPPDSTPET